jgi:acetylornithine deacetylase/succinyl-diaminopimelate desuccinylase-like protein
MMLSPVESALAYARENAARFRAQLVELLRIPSISTLPDHAADVERAAEWLIADLRRIGMTRAEIFRADGYLPLVYAEWLGAGEGAPTVLLYCHYDVQPAEIEAGWVTDPFDPVERDGKLYARGAVDSKSHVIIQLKALEALLAAGGPPVNIKLLFEGEEESGSEHIFQFVRDNRDLLRADACVLSDGSFPDVNQPVLDYGLRGIVAMEITVTGPTRDLHSGHYGGSVHNPIQALSAMLAQMHDADGRVLVPGFYDGVRPITDEERAVMADYERWVMDEWRSFTGAPQPWGEPEYRIHERLGARPTLEFNGIYGGFSGPGVKTVLPSKATVKITCRLVPDQDPDQVVERVRDFVAQITPPTVTSTFTPGSDRASGVIFDRDTPAMRAAAEAYARGWGARPIYAREGGSIPVVEVFQKYLSESIVLMPFGYKGCGAHSANEYVILDMFHKGIDTMIYFHDVFAEAFASAT